jgi:hypothetical protein
LLINRGLSLPTSEKVITNLSRGILHENTVF